SSAGRAARRGGGPPPPLITSLAFSSVSDAGTRAGLTGQAVVPASLVQPSTDVDLGTPALETAVALFERSTLFALLSPLALTLVAGCGASSGGTVKIGVAGAFDDPIGRPMQLAAELATAEINAAGGINGQKLELVEKNDYADPDSAVVVANALYQSDVSAVVGHLFSGTTLPASPVSTAGGDPVVAISPSSSSPEVSGAGAWTFRVCPSDDAQGAALARWGRDPPGRVGGA